MIAWRVGNDTVQLKLFNGRLSAKLMQCQYDADGSGDTGRTKAENLLVFFVEKILSAKKQRGSLVGLVADAGIQQRDRFDLCAIGRRCCDEFVVLHLAVVDERETRLTFATGKDQMSV